MSGPADQPEASPAVKLLPDGRPDRVSGSGNALGQSWLETAKHWDRDRRRANRTAKNDPQENLRVGDLLLEHAIYITGSVPQDDTKEDISERRVAAVIAGKKGHVPPRPRP